MLKKDITDEELIHKISTFIKAHPEAYTKYQQQFILKNYTWGRKTSLVPPILRQIYDELDLLIPEKNIYNGFLDIIEKNFDIENKNIIEISGGKLPNLGKKIALHQNKGTITVYDDDLISTHSNNPRLILKQERLKENQVLQNVDMIVGFMPQQGTEIAISIAKKNSLDMVIALGDGYGLGETEYLSGEDWQQAMLYEARKATRNADLGTLQLTDMKDYDNPHPVFYNKRKCK